MATVKAPTKVSAEATESPGYRPEDPAMAAAAVIQPDADDNQRRNLPTMLGTHTKAYANP